MEFRILGPLEVVDDGRRVALGGARRRALLALLLTHANEVVSTDRLIDGLWGARPPRAALNTLQFHVSRLRKALGSDVIVTQTPGYLIRIERGQLDLHRFEELVESAGRASPYETARALREALALWRGPALADVAFEPFAQAEVVRLAELRVAAHELRIAADLALGRHGELIGELETLVREHPLREGLRAQLILALYRAGRQADALQAYQETRRTLVDELGIEPGPPLQRLERAILVQDPALELEVLPEAPERSILVAPADRRRLPALLRLAEPLARRPSRELILAALVPDREELAAAAAELNERRAELVERGLAARAAAFTSAHRGRDLVRLATEQDVDLVLLDAPAEVLGGEALSPELETVLADAPSDVALLVATEDASRELGHDRPVHVPFGGGEHDWAAVEVAAWIAGALRAPLKLLGTEAGSARDASRLLATAALVVQRAIGIAAEPLLVPAGPEGIVGAAGEAGLLVLGLSDRWRQEGIGPARLAIARDVGVPTLLVRRGLRPSGVAPRGSLTRFTWSLASR